MCSSTGVGERLHKILGQIGSKLWFPHFIVFDQIFYKLAGNEDRHKISDEFEFRPYWTASYGLRCLERLKISHILRMGKWCLQASSFIFDSILIKLAGNQDRHKIWDGFEFRPDRISHFGVTCP